MSRSRTTMSRRHLRTFSRVAAVILCGACGSRLAANPTETAAQILSATGVTGGVIVHLDCGDGALTRALQRDDSLVVQGLDTNPDAVAATRRTLSRAGVYGPVSVDTFDGIHLPYVDDLVNLLVVEPDCPTPLPELMRVLAPGGILARRGRGDGPPTCTVKPRTAQLDSWGHYLYDASNNAVSKDTLVGPVGSLKWQCGPLWSRSHEFTSSVSVLVSDEERVFYVVDEGITSITTSDIPESWILIARDAFNGKQLWRMPLPEWRSRLGKNTALRAVPPTAQRCLVADGDRVYLSSLMGAPIRALDAATGQILSDYDATTGTREFVRTHDAIILYRELSDWKRQGTIARLDLHTGELTWESDRERYRGESLAANDQVVVHHTGASLVCRDVLTGGELWRTAPAKQTAQQRRARKTVILGEDLVLECGGSHIIARDARTGATRWQAKTGGKAMRGHDAFVARGHVWHAAGDAIVGYSLSSGEPTTTLDPTDVQSQGHHLRCYRAKATGNYLITQYRGVEFISLTGSTNSQTDWTRGACSFGVVPANGLLYVPPNPCFCYPGVKVRGLNAYTRLRRPVATARPRLVQGPAYASSSSARANAVAENPGDSWPTFRHDPRRHGSTRSTVPVHVAPAWELPTATATTPPVVAGGRLFVALKDRHSVLAADADTGQVLWRAVTGGRIDSPPSVHGGRVYVGSADGHVTCLTADTGALVWRFRAAPADDRIMVEDQLESVWPVHGSVLVTNDTVYVAAGRSSMLDGGIHLFGLDPATGEVRCDALVSTLSATRDDASGAPVIPSYAMAGTHCDILVSEGGAIYMGTAKFDLDLQQLPTPYAMDREKTTVAMDISKGDYITVDNVLRKGGYEAYRSYHRYQERAWPAMTTEYKARYGGMNLGDLQMGLHIAPTAGFLDDSWFNRTYWMYSTVWPGWYHAHRGAKTGNLLVVGREATYALQAYPERNMQSPLFTPGKDGYLLVADAKDNEPVLDFKTRGATKGLGWTRARPPLWHDWVPIRIRAMVEAGDILFVAGPPDVVPEDDPMAAFEGRRGGLLRALSARDGTIRSQLTLPAPPVFDGLIAAGGRLYLTLTDHRVLCLTAAPGPMGAGARTELAKLQDAQRQRRAERAAAAQTRTFGNAGVPLGEPQAEETAQRLSAAGRLPRDGWRVTRVSTVEATRTEFAPGKLLDGNPQTSWHSKWVNGRDPFPHEVIVDLGAACTVRELHLLPRQDRARNGRPKRCTVSTSLDGKGWGATPTPVNLPNSLDEKRIPLPSDEARFIRLVILEGYDQDLSAIAELNVVGNLKE